MAAPKRRLPAPLYDISKKLRDRGKDPQDIAWDSYFIPGAEDNVLRNKLGSKNEPYGCTDKDELTRHEERLTAFRMIELKQHPIRGDYSLDHMRAIHRHLFQDVYEWAGEPRTVDMVKEGHEYLSHTLVEKMWTNQHAGLKKVDMLKGVSDQPTFVTNLAAHWGLVNATHAFREGNTRSQVVFFAQMAEEAGWHLDVARLAPDHPDSIREEFIAARYHHQDNQFDPGPLARALNKITTPIEQLEQRLQRAATPSVEHERWAPPAPGQPDLMHRAIARQTTVVEPDDYTHPDKMRTAHRRIASQETAVPIDPSRNAQSTPPVPADEPVNTLVIGQTRHGMTVQREGDEASVIDQFTGEDGYEDTRSIELMADLEADLAEEPARLAREAAQEERFRRFPELRPSRLGHTPLNGRHRAPDAGPEL